MNKLTKDQILSIQKLREEGKTIKDTSLSLGVSAHTISYWVKRLKSSGHEMKVKTKRGVKPIDISLASTPLQV